MRTRQNLLEIAGRYARERRAPANVIVKELLHYEILYAMVQSGLASTLVFQGGTCLRLCHGGNRYSEDLDFVTSEGFKQKALEDFTELLRLELSDAYGLNVDVVSKAGAIDDAVPVARYRTKIHVPNPDPSAPQSQLINVEVASVPAHDPVFTAVSPNYAHLPAPLRSIILQAETPAEILADKVVALGARPYIKARDVWDIKFLLDRGIGADLDLVQRKLGDYGIEAAAFREKLERRITELQDPATAKKFETEMLRFVDAAVASQLKGGKFAADFLKRSIGLATSVLADLPNSNAAPSSPGLSS